MYTSAAPRNTIARNPSHLGSNRKSPSSGRASASLASIGSIGGAGGGWGLAGRRGATFPASGVAPVLSIPPPVFFAAGAATTPPPPPPPRHHPLHPQGPG